MKKREIRSALKRIFKGLKDNMTELPGEGVTVPVFEEPVIGFASADDPAWSGYKSLEAIGPEWMSPAQWMEGAKTVISIFYPFSEEIRSRARVCPEETCEAWNMGLNAANGYLVKEIETALEAVLKEAGAEVLIPAFDPRMKTVNIPVVSGGRDDLHYIPAWSERHAAYMAGIGTFGIHRHLISEKGCAGRYGSLITDLRLKPDPRNYTGLYDYCVRCGACIGRCPVNAISDEHLRNLRLCSGRSAYIRQTYGSGSCGKCLTGVPCEHGIPAAKLSRP